MKTLPNTLFLLLISSIAAIISPLAHALEPRPFDSNYYAVIGATPEMDSGEIASAWKKALLQYHPDRAPNDANRERFGEATKRIIEAGKVLKNADRRALYDMTSHHSGYSPASGPTVDASVPSETAEERTIRIERVTYLTLKRDLQNLSLEPGLIAQKMRLVLSKRFPLPGPSKTVFVGGSHSANARAMSRFINENISQAIEEINKANVNEDQAMDSLNELAHWPFEPPFNYEYKPLVLQHYRFHTREAFIKWAFQTFRHLDDDGSETAVFESRVTANLTRLYGEGTPISKLYLEFAEISVSTMKSEFPFIADNTFELLISAIVAHPTPDAVEALKKLATLKPTKAKANEALTRMRAENPGLQDNSLLGRCRRLLGGS